MHLLARLAADAIVILHAGFAVFVLVSQLLILCGGVRGWNWVRNRWFRVTHLACIGVVVLESWAGIVCPLTVWEKSLRAQAGAETYDGDFIAHWVHELLFFDMPVWVFTVAYSLFGTLVLGSLWLIPPRWRRARAPGAGSVPTRTGT